MSLSGIAVVVPAVCKTLFIQLVEGLMLSENGNKDGCGESCSLLSANSSGENRLEHECVATLDLLPLPLVVVNAQRQAVFSNTAFLEFFGTGDVDDVVGHRPGEIINCSYCHETKQCDTSIYCEGCKAKETLLESVSTDTKVERDCEMLQFVDGEIKALNIRVTVAPWVLSGEKFYLVMLQDVAEQKQLESMQRILFKDVLESVKKTENLLSSMKIHDEQDEKVLELASRSFYGLADQVKSLKLLQDIESGKYDFKFFTYQSLEIVGSVADEFSRNSLSEGRYLEVYEGSFNASLKVDYDLLRRVLLNMLANAVEASCEGDVIMLGTRQTGANVLFWVHNDQVIEKPIQLQIFKRGFSTKGAGRGIGTYAMKVVGENCLNGKVGFSSKEDQGTTFWIRLDYAE